MQRSLGIPKYNSASEMFYAKFLTSVNGLSLKSHMLVTNMNFHYL